MGVEEVINKGLLFYLFLLFVLSLLNTSNFKLGRNDYVKNN